MSCFRKYTVPLAFPYNKIMATFHSLSYVLLDINKMTGAMSPKFGDGHSLKCYGPELLAGVIFDVSFLINILK